MQLTAKRVGLKILGQMIEKGYNVKDVQNYLGLSCPQSVYKWLRGDAYPSIQNLYQLSKLFGCKVDDLL